MYPTEPYSEPTIIEPMLCDMIAKIDMLDQDIDIRLNISEDDMD